MLRDICSEWRFEGEQAPVRGSNGKRGLLESGEQSGLNRWVSKGAGTRWKGESGKHRRESAGGLLDPG